jgi:hypothetical protein
MTGEINPEAWHGMHSIVYIEMFSAVHLIGTELSHFILLMLISVNLLYKIKVLSCRH